MEEENKKEEYRGWMNKATDAAADVFFKLKKDFDYSEIQLILNEIEVFNKRSLNEETMMHYPKKNR